MMDRLLDQSQRRDSGEQKNRKKPITKGRNTATNNKRGGDNNPNT